MCVHVSQKPSCFAVVMQSTVLGEAQAGLPVMVPACCCMEMDPQGLQWVVLYREALARPPLLLVAHAAKPFLYEVNEMSRW